MDDGFRSDPAPSAPGDESGGMVRCEVTGKPVPAEDAVEFQGKIVSAEGKAILLGILRNGGDPADHGRTESLRPGFWRRFLCSSLDMVILIAGVMVFAFVFFFAIDTRLTGDEELFVTWFAQAMVFVYYTVMHAVFGKTVGKMAGGVRVVTMAGEPIGWWTSLVRAFWYCGVTMVLAVAGTFIGGGGGSLLGILSSVYNWANAIVLLADREYNRALHDLLAGTRVVMDRR